MSQLENDKLTAHAKANSQEANRDISIIEETFELIAELKSMQMATTSKQDKVDISYTPYLYEPPFFYVYTSLLSKHTRNMLDCPRLSILIIEDESQSKNIFARRRVSFECQAQPILRKDQLWPEILDKFESRHGSTVSLLRQLEDFHLFQLQVSSGLFVKGFGQAFQLEGTDFSRITQLRGEKISN